MREHSIASDRSHVIVQQLTCECSLGPYHPSRTQTACRDAPRLQRPKKQPKTALVDAGHSATTFHSAARNVTDAGRHKSGNFSKVPTFTAYRLMEFRPRLGSDRYIRAIA